MGSFRSRTLRVLIETIMVSALIFVFSGVFSPTQAAANPPMEQQLAAISKAISSLWHILGIAKSKLMLAAEYSATSTNCPSGYHYMSDTGGYCMADGGGGTCQPLGGGATYTCPSGGGSTSTYSTGSSYSTSCRSYADEAGCRAAANTSAACVWYANHYDGNHCDDGAHGSGTPPSSSYSPGPSYSSCSSSLTDLLGTGCHQMYTDSTGSTVYCDGPMTKSAKQGDTAAAAGCQSSTSSSYSSTPPQGQLEQVWNSLGLRSWIRSGADQARIDSLKQACANVSSGSNVWLPESGNSSSADFGMPDAAKCGSAAACASSQYFNGASCVAGTSSGGTTWNTTTTNTSTGSQTTATASRTGGLAASTAGGEVVLNWSDFSQWEDEYQIERRVGSGNWATIATIAPLASTPGTYRDAGVSSGTYDYRVRPCVRSSGCSGESNTVRATVGGTSSSTVAPVTALQPPVISNITATNVTTNSANISWTTDIQANSKVEYGIGSLTGTLVSDSTFVINHSLALTGLQASTTYTYSVISENQDYYRTTFSNKTFTTLQNTPTSPVYSLTAPTNLAVRVDTNGKDAMLTWIDNSIEEEYKIERKTGAANWVVVASTPAQSGVGSYRDAGLANGTYEYRVKACGGGACSPESNPATVTATGASNVTYSSCDASLVALLGDGCHQMYTDSTGNTVYCDGSMGRSAKRGDTASATGCTASFDGTSTTTATAIPVPPSGLNAVQSGGNVVLSWDDNAANESEYKVEWHNQTSWVAFGSIGAIYGGRGAYTDYSPSARTHQYRVKACNALGCSAESNIATVTVTGTSAGPCPSGYHVMSPSITAGGGYCMSDSAPTACQPLGGGATHACPTTSTATTTPPAVPVILSISPNSGPMGTRVTITGSGFMATGNRINFDTGVITDLASPDGTTLVFTVPEDRVPFCAVTDPRCLLPAPYNPVRPGTYWVSVINANGASASLSFSVTESVAAVFAVDSSGTTPKPGATGISAAARIKVRLTREFDTASLAGEFFKLARTSAPDTRVSGSFAVSPDGFEFLPSGELEPNTSYTYTVFASLRDRSGVSLSAPYAASFTTSGAVSQNATLSGKVTDSGGAPLASTYIHVFSAYAYYAQAAASYQNYFSRNAETDSNGAYQLSLPAGVYTIEAYVPSERTDLARATPREITLGAGETRTVNFTLGGVTKTIAGRVSFANGNPVTDAEVSAYLSEARQWTSSVIDTAGRYTLNVGGGTWSLGVHPRDPRQTPWSWYEKPRIVTFSRNSTSETKTADFTVPLRDATITVTVLDNAGSALANVGVVTDTRSGASQTAATFWVPPEFRITANDGKARFTLRAGTYYVRAYLPPDRGYFNPDEQEIFLAGEETTEVKLIFQKKQSGELLAISGLTKTEEGVPTDAFVWAWSERGGFLSTRADQQGKFLLNITPNERWHLGAGKEYKGFPYKSAELVVDVKNEPVTVELALTKQALVPLPPTVNVTHAAAQQVVAQAADGAQFTLPPGSVVSSGNVQVEIKPTIEAPSQAGMDVVSTVYDITVRDSAGNSVSALAQDAEIVIPYSEDDLKKQGVTEDTIVPSYFDEKAGTWINLKECTIDKDRNAAVCRVDHLTRFAITARADATPPSAPTAVTATADGQGKVKLTWKNPAKDFDYAKIYRSAKSGGLGAVRVAALRASQFTDSEGLANGITYYYTVRAVDSAGNESPNTNQVSVRAAGTSGAASAKTASKETSSGKSSVLSRTLQRGARGNDVKALQQVLIKEGLLESGSDTGFFGAATETALKKLQVKFRLEAVGIAGPATRKKVNEILGQ